VERVTWCVGMGSPNGQQFAFWISVQTLDSMHPTFADQHQGSR